MPTLDEFSHLPTGDDTYAEAFAFVLSNEPRLISSQATIAMNPPNPYMRIKTIISALPSPRRRQAQTDQCI